MFYKLKSFLRNSRGFSLFPVIMVVLALSFAISCKDGETLKATSIAHDPAKPVDVTTFMPDSGGIRTKFVIKGSNFGNDKSKVSVFFKDDEYERKAVVVGVDNETIYCLVPRQNGGSNNVKVTIDGKDALTSKTFKYFVAQNVSHIVGSRGDGKILDGSLAEGRINRTFGIATIGNEEIITFESLVNAVRFVSVPSNKIITLQTSFDGTHPAITKDRKKIYSIGRAVPHKVFVYEKDNLWSPRILATQIPNASGVIFSACLDKGEDWLYFRDKSGLFGRLEIANPTNVETIKSIPVLSSSSDYNYMVYSAVDDCFFTSNQGNHTIYKVSKNGDVEIYAGGGGLGRADGLRRDATFNQPSGLAVDSEGNLYIADSSNHTIRKVNRLTGLVTLLAGIPGKQGGDSGVPLLSTFDYPYCLSEDENGSIFIGESWGTTIRKLAIE